jgi:hypothetical protein
VSVYEVCFWRNIGSAYGLKELFGPAGKNWLRVAGEGVSLGAACICKGDGAGLKVPGLGGGAN